MFFMLSLALADTFWDVTPAQAAKIAEAIQPGDLLLRWCEGCGPEAVMFEVREDRLAAGLYSDGKQVQVLWRAKGQGVADSGMVFRDGFSCGKPTTCLPDAQVPCAGEWAYLDIPYTYRLDLNGDWVWVGSYAKLEGRPAELTMNPELKSKVGLCRAVKPGVAAPSTPTGD